MRFSQKPHQPYKTPTPHHCKNSQIHAQQPLVARIQNASCLNLRFPSLNHRPAWINELIHQLHIGGSPAGFLTLSRGSQFQPDIALIFQGGWIKQLVLHMMLESIDLGLVIASSFPSRVQTTWCLNPALYMFTRKICLPFWTPVPHRYQCSVDDQWLWDFGELV